MRFVWFGLHWFALDCIGLHWFALDRFGSVRKNPNKPQQAEMQPKARKRKLIGLAIQISCCHWSLAFVGALFDIRSQSGSREPIESRRCIRLRFRFRLRRALNTDANANANSGCWLLALTSVGELAATLRTYDASLKSSTCPRHNCDSAPA